MVNEVTTVHHGGPFDGISQKFEIDFVPTSILFGKNGEWYGEYRRDETAPVRGDVVDLYWHKL